MRNAYGFTLAFHFNEAQRLLEAESDENPGNDIVLLYYNYIDFLKAFSSEEKSDYDSLIGRSNRREKTIRLDKANQLSPFYLYILAEFQIQRALLEVKFGDNIQAALNLKNAYNSIIRNARKFPGFILNGKILGFIHSLVGSVPPKFQWLVSLSGMEGNLGNGISELKLAYRQADTSIYSCYRGEILFYLGSIYSMFSISSDSFKIYDEIQKLIPSNPLLAYTYINMLMKRGANDEALVELNRFMKNKDTINFNYLYYNRGLAHLRKLDAAAQDDFTLFINKYKGVNYLKSAYQKLAWISLIRGDTIGYKKYLEQCAISGNTIVDEDKEAQLEAESGLIPNVYLLKARTLFDGGYYQASLEQISDKSIRDFPSFKEQLEVTYRVSRIMHMMGQIEQAINNYEATIRIGSASRFYYAANSSLLLGNIYESQGNIAKAKFYYQLCLSMKNTEYKNSIDQKAKLGLERLKDSSN